MSERFDREVTTTCGYCGVGCRLEAHAREEASPAIASGPCSRLMRVNSVTIRAVASAQLAGRKPSCSRISGVVNRSREREN